mmetsp:Transcript_7913/g.13695  ORF Transcript_7913/g.13695 Transcript_7913/m.13695 type:complete len:254 (-) Transcript_7913:710-1471(-)
MATSLLEVTVKLRFDIHPSKTNDIFGGVKEQLNQKLMRYDEEFGGVVLAYFNETLLDTKAPILISLPYASVDVRATLLLFKPMVGRPLEGVVNKVGVDHLGVLVLGVFNASIAIEATGGAFEYDAEESCWAGSDDFHHQIREGTKIRLILRGQREVDNLLSLQGELGLEGTGSVEYLRKNAARAGEKDKGSSAKKKKKSKEKSGIHLEENGNGETRDKSAEKKKRKKSEREEEDESDGERKKRDKKKRKKDRD